mgnify:CR=1 FL=1
MRVIYGLHGYIRVACGLHTYKIGLHTSVYFLEMITVIFKSPEKQERILK